MTRLTRLILSAFALCLCSNRIFSVILVALEKWEGGCMASYNYRMAQRRVERADMDHMVHLG